MSTAILTLSENGDLQKIHDKWLLKQDCSTQENNVDLNKLSLSSFWGLFLICGIACLLALIAFFTRVLCQYTKFSPEHEQHDEEISPVRPKGKGPFGTTNSFRNLIYFVDKKEKEIKEILKQKSKKRRRSLSLDGQSSSSA